MSPQTAIKTDIHCVTKWSKLDTTWRGVTFDDLLKAAGLAEAPAPFVMAHCDSGYTTNVPVADLVGGKGMIATRYEGLPIPPVHGGPARLLVPHLYFWKSAKWVRRLRFMEKDEPVSGSCWAITTTAIPGKSSDMTATETPTAAPRRLEWRLAQVREVVVETPRLKSLLLHVQAGRDMCPASMSISGSRPKTAIRRSAAIRSPRLPRTNCSL